ncbi:MAG: signal peptidase I [Micrococcales bacterium]|nr:signal peptidase I [Micrococcales bacterium]
MSTTTETTDRFDLPKVHRVEHSTSRLARAAKAVAWTLFWAVVASAVVLTTAVFIVPQSQAGSGLTVLTGSMRPTYQPGDVVAVRGIKAHEVCRNVNPGDVVTFMPNTDDYTMVTHRVVRVYDYDGYESCTVVTKGDANNVEDPPVPARAVKGVVMYSIPKVGYALNWTQQQDTRAVMVIGAGVCFALGSYFLVARRAKKLKDPDYTI